MRYSAVRQYMYMYHAVLYLNVNCNLLQLEVYTLYSMLSEMQVLILSYLILQYVQCTW